MNKDEWQKKGEGHRGRLRDKFLQVGLDGLSDAEVLELLLSFGTPRSDCKDAARQALKKFGSLAAVLEATTHDLQEIQGVGPKNSFAIHFVQAISGKYLQDRLRGKRYLHSSEEVKQYLLHSMRGLKKEVFTVIYLDSSHAIIQTEVVAEGTVNVNTIYPRELMKRVLEVNATALIIAHNHPSGSLQPSPQDLHLTKSLSLLSSMMQVTLLDHFIIGDDAFSFAENGLLASIKEEVTNIVQSMS